MAISLDEIKKEQARLESEKNRKAQNAQAYVNRVKDEYILYTYEKIRKGCICAAARGDYKTKGIFRKRKYVEYDCRLYNQKSVDGSTTQLLACNFFKNHRNEANEVVRLLANEGIIIKWHSYNEYCSYYTFHVYYEFTD